MTTARLVTTPALARALGVPLGVVRGWARAGLITPDLKLPSGHYRWVEADVRAQLRRLYRAISAVVGP